MMPFPLKPWQKLGLSESQSRTLWGAIGIVLIVMAAFALWRAEDANDRTHSLVVQNARQISRINALEKERATRRVAFQRTDVINCRANNQLRNILRDEKTQGLKVTLKNLDKLRKALPEFSEKQIQDSLTRQRRVIKKLAPKKCGELPSQDITR